VARRNRYYSGPPGDNFDGTRFFLKGHGGTTTQDYIKWNFTASPARWPWRVRNRTFPPPPERAAAGELFCTWIGHSTALIQVAGLNILTDPFFSRRASPFQWAGPRRVRPPALPLDQLPPIDLVVVSHNHYDHMDLPSLKKVMARWKPRLVTPLGNAAILSKALPHGSMTELDWWEASDVLSSEIMCTPAYHWSKRTLHDTNHALWGGFAIRTRADLVYFAGDTGYDDGRLFQEIRQRLGSPRLALLPIGAYEPRWFMKHEHMNPDEAVRAHLDLQSSLSIGIHHATIRLTDEAIDAPARAHAEAMRQHGVPEGSFIVPDAGECISIPA
jgi:L-ascorbate metabolism protein UlaG (beta-lactamase superfamily)